MQNSVTEESIKEKIVGEMYLVLPDGRSTLCMLTLRNGYTIKGFSACVDAANFDANVGRRIAFEDAFRQIWPLEGYLLAEKLYWDSAKPVASKPPKRVTLNRQQVEVIKKYARAQGKWGLKKDGTPKKRPGRAPKEQA